MLKETLYITVFCCKSLLHTTPLLNQCLPDRRDKMKRESMASKLLEEKHQLKRLWLEVQLSVVCVRAQHCSSHRRCRIPHFPSLRLLPRSRYGKALRLQPQWANSQPVATAPIHNHRIEGSPKLKALLSLRLGATASRSDRLISSWRLGWPWLWPLVCGPCRHSIQSCSPGPFGTRSSQEDRNHKACTESQRKAYCYQIPHCANGEWEFQSMTPLFFFFFQLSASPNMSLWMNLNIMYY